MEKTVKALPNCSMCVDTQRLHHKQALWGFTLIEILVALLILALVSGLVLINFLPNRQDRLQDEASRLRWVLVTAADFARLSGQYLAWVVNEKNTGYAFEVQQTNQKWKAFHNNHLLAKTLTEYTFSDSVLVLKLAINEVPLKKPPLRVIFDPSGINQTFTLTLGIKDDDTLTRTLVGDPMGKVFDLYTTQDSAPSTVSQTP